LNLIQKKIEVPQIPEDLTKVLNSLKALAGQSFNEKLQIYKDTPQYSQYLNELNDKMLKHSDIIHDKNVMMWKSRHYEAIQKSKEKIEAESEKFIIFTSWEKFARDIIETELRKRIPSSQALRMVVDKVIKDDFAHIANKIKYRTITATLIAIGLGAITVFIILIAIKKK